MEWYLKALRQYFDFKGRARRREFWMFTLINIIIEILLSLSGVEFLSGLYSLFVFIPSIAVSVRRLHDVGISGMWLILFLFPAIALVIPVVGPIIVLLLWVLLIIFFIWYLIMDGEPEPNKWGESPKSEYPGESGVKLLTDAIIGLLLFIAIFCIAYAFMDASEFKMPF